MILTSSIDDYRITHVFSPIKAYFIEHEVLNQRRSFCDPLDDLLERLPVRHRPLFDIVCFAVPQQF